MLSLTFKCDPSPPKNIVQTRKLWRHLGLRSLGEQAQAMGRGRGRGQPPCPTGSQLLVSTWKVLCPTWPTKLDAICPQAVSSLNASPPKFPHCSLRPSPEWTAYSLSLKHNKLIPTQHCDSSMFVFPPHSYVEAATTHAMALGHGVFGRLTGLDEVMRWVAQEGICALSRKEDTQSLLSPMRRRLSESSERALPRNKLVTS